MKRIKKHNQELAKKIEEKNENEEIEEKCWKKVEKNRANESTEVEFQRSDECKQS